MRKRQQNVEAHQAKWAANGNKFPGVSYRKWASMRGMTPDDPRIFRVHPYNHEVFPDGPPLEEVVAPVHGRVRSRDDWYTSRGEEEWFRETFDCRFRGGAMPWVPYPHPRFGDPTQAFGDNVEAPADLDDRAEFLCRALDDLMT